MRSPIAVQKLTSANDSSPLFSPGEVVEVVDSEGLKRYKYVKYDSGTANLTLAAGDVVCYLDGSDFDGYTVTKDISDTVANLVAGVAQNAISDGYYGWIQTWGYYDAVSTNGDDDITAGQTLIASGDGTVDSVLAGTAPTYIPLGVAVDADNDAADTVPAYIRIE